MTREIETTIRTRLTNPSTASATLAQLKELFEHGPIYLTQTTQAAFRDVVTVTTSEQDIDLTTGSTFTAALQGIFCAINLDSTNYVKLGPKSGGSMVEMARLYPMHPQQITIAPSVILRWVADTASCKVAFVWFAK